MILFWNFIANRKKKAPGKETCDIQKVYFLHFIKKKMSNIFGNIQKPFGTPESPEADTLRRLGNASNLEDKIKALQPDVSTVSVQQNAIYKIKNNAYDSITWKEREYLMMRTTLGTVYRRDLSKIISGDESVRESTKQEILSRFNQNIV